MRNAIIVALGLVCAAVILSTGGLDAQSENAARPSLNLTGTLALLDPPQPHVVGITKTTFPPFSLFGGPGALPINRACFAEFPETNVCTLTEVLNAFPPPSPWPDLVIVSNESRGFGGFPAPVGIICIDSDGAFPTGRIPDCPIESPVICCGF